MTNADRIKNRRSLIARKSMLKMENVEMTAEEKRAKIRKMNEEAEQMGQEAEQVMAEL